MNVAVNFKAQKAEFQSEGESMGFVEDFDFYELCQYFSMEKGDFGNNEMMGKIKNIYDWARKMGNVIESVRDLDIRLGKPQNLDKLNKIYTFIALDNEESRDIQEVLEIQRQKRKLYA